ncbi:MAG TPA: sodium:proton antiporter [Clostridiales bacterium]|nr:MAG: hypothetical protein A2Y22_02780 [Clostridiales bacterium GWD2_32_59]HAN10733.1 sodium:proton antiporter [Clostridiales bacterium]
MSYILTIGIILIVSKLFGIASKRMYMPRVVGALMVGIVLGPTLLGVIHEDEILKVIAEIGVIILMFEAGLETDINRFKKNMKAYFIVAMGGVIAPFVFGFAIGTLFNFDVMTSVFIGAVLTATSVSITVETLNEMKKLDSTAGRTILGAALVDDVIGIIILSVLISRVNAAAEPISMVLAKIVIFFVIAYLSGIQFRKFFKWLSESEGRKRRIPVFALGFCLLFAYFAERFGVADITGAYIAGLIFSNMHQTTYIREKVEVVSYMFFGPIFFASIGMAATLTGMTYEILFFAVMLTVFAIISKIIGGYFGSRISKINKTDSLKISFGMIARGEVALIIATKAKTSGLITEPVFAAVVIMVIVTTVITPILLQYSYKKNKHKLHEDIIE